MTPTSAGVPAVSVILVTYNAWEHTRRCLDHLLAEPFDGGLEVILVDNASEDGTVAAQKILSCIARTDDSHQFST